MQLQLSLPTSASEPLPTTASPASPPRRTSRWRPFSRRPSAPFLIISFALAVLFIISIYHTPGHPATSFTGNVQAESWSDWDGWKDLDPLEQGKDLLGLGSCAEWNPLSSEERDPVGCLRARQYRQVQRVLDREEKGEHGHWWFTQKTNIVTLRKLARCYLPTTHHAYTKCPDRPVVINGYWWSALTLLNGTSGELKQFDSFGIMTLFVGDYSNWITVAEMMPDVYRFVWAPELDVISCFTDPRCVAKEHYVPPQNATDLSVDVPDEERGVIPIWRLQIVDYWGSQPKEVSNNDHYWGLKKHGEWSYHPLGTEWIQVPWPMPGHVHLPYSIEEYCLKLPVKPHAERDNSVLIFAKKSSYFHMKTVPPIQFWTDLSHQLNFQLLSTAEVEEGMPMPEGLETMGRQSRAAYEEVVGSSKVLLGMGFPPISPSVYTALCQGTPVVLPYKVEKKIPPKSTDGWEVYSGHFQHGPAMAIGPPYVYSYYKGNYTQLLEAVNTALSTPIERYIPEDMRLPYALARTKAFLNRDLHAMFRRVLRQNYGKVPRLIAGARERCAELKRCKPPLEEGRRPKTPEWSRKMEGVEKERHKIGKA